MKRNFELCSQSDANRKESHVIFLYFELLAWCLTHHRVPLNVYAWITRISLVVGQWYLEPKCQGSNPWLLSLNRCVMTIHLLLSLSMKKDNNHSNLIAWMWDLNVKHIGQGLAHSYCYINLSYYCYYYDYCISLERYLLSSCHSFYWVLSFSLWSSLCQNS